MRSEEIWDEVLLLLEDRVNRQTFDTWFKPVAVDSIDGEVLRIAVPNRFFEEWIREHYYRVLCEEAGRVLNTPNIRKNS